MTASEKLSSRHNLGDQGPVIDDAVTELASKLVDARLSGSDSKAVTTNMFDPNHEFDLAELELDHEIAQLAAQSRSRKVSTCTDYASYLFNRRLIISNLLSKVQVTGPN
jgi:hypothetical protein